MHDEPNYTAILALLKGADQAGKTKAEGERAVKLWQAEQSGQFRADQASVVTDVQDALAKGLTLSLGAYLQASFETTSVSVTLMTYRKALELAPKESYFLSLRAQEAPVVLQIERTIVFPLIDVLLGGAGAGQTDDRDVTEIENHVMEGVCRIFSHEIATAWGINSRDCNVIGTQGLAQLQRLMSANDRVVVFQFECKLGEVAGDLRLLVPGTTFNALLRKLSTDIGQGKSSKSNSPVSRLREKMLECSFPVSLEVSNISLPVNRVLSLAPDQVCDLGIPVSLPSALIIAGRESFDANPVRQGRKRAAHLGKERTLKSEGIA
jgi:flagellar motor switch protein FliM